MKQLEIFFRTFWLAFFFLVATSFIQAAESYSDKMDSVEISLITCTPHEEIYSLYGHTALRYHNLSTGQDLLFNYGVFNYKAPHFVARFVLGKTDYELGVIPMKPFCKEYRKWGSGVYEQVLDISNEEKHRIALALSLNMRPENRVYRYNFFYDNCSTRPRDIIERNLYGEIVRSKQDEQHPTYREMIHSLNSHHPWMAFGIDLLLGVKADLKTDQRQQEFLPLNLMHNYDNAQIYSDGQYRPLVKERRILVESGIQQREEDFPLSPTLCALLLLLLTITVSFFDWKKTRGAGISGLSLLFDALFMLITGLIGCLLFIMIFSEHPTTSINLQILLLNPLSLLFIVPVVKRKPTRYWNIIFVCLILFFIGSFLQDYAEGLEIVALCLLIRYWIHKRNDK